MSSPRSASLSASGHRSPASARQSQKGKTRDHRPRGVAGGHPPLASPRPLPGRLRAVAEAVRGKGIGALLLTPGPDLRYVTGYDAKQLERLTCLVIPAEGDPFLLVPQ